MSRFFGNRTLRARYEDPFLIRAYLCPPPPLSDEETAKLKSDHEATVKAKDAELAKMKADYELATKKKPDDPDDLAKKAEKERFAKEQKAKETQALESAIRFSQGAPQWLKENESLLPKDVAGVFASAEKEKYDSSLEKDAAIKSGVITAFFNLQANLDLLTPSQKSAIEEFQKLSNNGKQEKAPQLYDSIFEPTFEMIKRVKKAQQLNNGDKNQSDGEKALADRMMKLSKKHYLGEKHES